MSQRHHPEGRKTIAAYESGVSEGLRRSLPFTGRPRIADFPSGSVIYDQVISYEQRLLRSIPERHRAIEDCRNVEERERDKLDAVERRYSGLTSSGNSRSSIVSSVDGFFLRRRLRAELHSCIGAKDLADARHNTAREQLEWVYEELVRVRLWLDSFVNTAENYCGVRPGLRRTPEPEPPPPNVRIYPSADAFVAENPARGVTRVGVLSGADFGYDWTWQDYDRPWLITQWRVSFIDELGELYALQTRPDTRAGYSWRADPTKIDLPVWLLNANLPASRLTFSFYPSPVWEWLTKLESELQKRPNSLLALAEAVNTPPDALAQCAPNETDAALLE